MTGNELAELVGSGAEVWIELHPAETRSVKSASVVRVIDVRADRLGLLVDLEDGDYRWSLWRPIRMGARVRVGGQTGRIELVTPDSH